MKPLFWACAGLSLALHGALAIAWQPRAAPVAAALGERSLAPLHSRLIVRPSSLPPPALRAATAAATTTTNNAPTAAQHDLPDPQAPAEPAAETGRQAQAGAPAETVTVTLTETETGTETVTETDTTANAAGWDQYLPRSQLSVGPSPREHILLGYPDDGPAVGRFMLTLALYIDERGAVRRVDVASDEALPDTLRQAARLAFTGQRFTPGERAGEVVKSRIRIEVLFESLALPTFAANATAPEGVTAH